MIVRASAPCVQTFGAVSTPSTVTQKYSFENGVFAALTSTSLKSQTGCATPLAVVCIRTVPVATGTPRQVTEGTRSYQVWDFNDVDVSAANTPFSKIYFWVTMDGFDVRTNVWTHGADARTIMPGKNAPTESCR